MPYKTVEARRAYRQQWEAAHPGRKRIRDTAYRDRHRQEIREYHNERNWRFRLWEVAHLHRMFRLGGLRLGTAHEIDDPLFIFTLNGRRRVETLHDPMPWPLP